MIMGLACTMGGWNPQLDELLAEDEHGRPLTQVRWLSALLELSLCRLAGLLQDIFQDGWSTQQCLAFCNCMCISWPCGRRIVLQAR